jgi:hypothetical protein
MNHQTFALFVGAFAVTLGGMAVVVACNSSTQQTQPARVSRKGEACQTTNDCASGLNCIPASSGGGVCVVSEFNVSKTAKSCDVIECEIADDCCTNTVSNPTECDMFKAQCADAGMNPSNFYCMEYQSLCTCDTTKLTCENGHCKSHCNLDSDCTKIGFPRCSGGTCVECDSDSQCNAGEGFYCDNSTGSCQPPCQTDGDCPSFNRCTNARCVQGTCQTDRECIAATRNVQATCRTDGTCVVPCQTDLECGSPMNYTFQSCLDGYCQYTGCQDDKECALYFSHGTDASVSFGSHSHIVCRDVATSTQ